MRKLYWFVLLVVFIWQLGQQLLRVRDPDLYIVFCDVGQGDATLIWKGSTQILVDGGPNSAVVDCLSRYLPWFDRQIELVINTHAETDHAGGLAEVITRYQPGLVVSNGWAGSNQAWQELAEALLEKQQPIYVAFAGDELKLDDLSLKVLWPLKANYTGGLVSDPGTLPATETNLNELSLVLRLEYGSFELFLSGDIGQEEELAIIDNNLLTPVEVLKVAHHGSKYSSSAEFLNRLRPEWAVIEVGGNNSYGHPTREVLSRLDTVGARIFRTDKDGDVRLASDGQQVWRW